MRSLFAPTMAALAALATSTPALAQATAPTAAAPATASPECQAGISKDARNLLVDYQTAVVAKDAVNMPIKLAAAKAAAKTADDRCFIALLEVKAAMDANNLKAVPAALEAQLASGSVPAAKVGERFEALARAQYDAKAYADAGVSLTRAAALAPGRPGTVVMIAEIRAKEGRATDAVPLYKQAIALEKAAGRKPDENWYKRAVKVAYDARSPETYALSRDWVAAYPSPTAWRDAVGLYAAVSSAPADTMVDLWRLQRLTKSLKGESDHGRYAQELIARGYSGEAKAVLEEGVASGAVSNSANIKTMLSTAAGKAAGDRASLDGQSKAALSSPAAKQALVLGDAYYGYGDYAKAAAMYRAALGKSGVDANLVNLRLGMTLAASGDKAGAAAALAKVSGARAEVARYWATYAATRA